MRHGKIGVAQDTKVNWIGASRLMRMRNKFNFLQRLLSDDAEGVAASALHALMDDPALFENAESLKLLMT